MHGLVRGYNLTSALLPYDWVKLFPLGMNAAKVVYISCKCSPIIFWSSSYSNGDIHPAATSHHTTSTRRTSPQTWLARTNPVVQTPKYYLHLVCQTENMFLLFILTSDLGNSCVWRTAKACGHYGEPSNLRDRSWEWWGSWLRWRYHF